MKACGVTSSEGPGSQLTGLCNPLATHTRVVRSWREQPTCRSNTDPDPDCFRVSPSSWGMLPLIALITFGGVVAVAAANLGGLAECSLGGSDVLHRDSDNRRPGHPETLRRAA